MNTKLTIRSLTIAAILTTLLSNSNAQIKNIKFDPVGNYLGVLHPVSHTNPATGTHVVSAYFTFTIQLDPSGVRLGTGTGNAFIGGKRTTLTESSFVSTPLTLVGGIPVPNINGDIDFTMNWKIQLTGALSDTDYEASGKLIKVPSNSTSIYFRKLTHADPAAQLKSAEIVGMTLVTSPPTTCTVEASGGAANLALDRVKIRRPRPGGSRSFFRFL